MESSSVLALICLPLVFLLCEKNKPLLLLSPCFCALCFVNPMIHCWLHSCGTCSIFDSSILVHCAWISHWVLNNLKEVYYQVTAQALGSSRPGVWVRMSGARYPSRWNSKSLWPHTVEACCHSGNLTSSSSLQMPNLISPGGVHGNPL